VAGGLKITEPAADIAVLMAIVSSLKGIPAPVGTVMFGEIGLTGEIRAVTRAGFRLNEAARLGFKHCIMPGMGREQLDKPGDFDVAFARNVMECAGRLGF
jgi:DNA repair protein RadA/Sms